MDPFERNSVQVGVFSLFPPFELCLCEEERKLTQKWVGTLLIRDQMIQLMKCQQHYYYLRLMTFNQLEGATENFNENTLLGECDFGKVYKGQLERTIQDVAIKGHNAKSSRGDVEFRTEIRMLNALRHPNVVILVRY